MKGITDIAFLKRFSSDLRTLRRLVPFFKNLKPLIFLSIALGFLSSFVESIAVGLIILFIYRSLSVPDAMPDDGVIYNFLQIVDYITADSFVVMWVMIICIILLKSAILGGYQLLSDYVANTIHHRIRSALFEKYMSLPYKDLAKMDHGSMVNALYVECWYVSEAVRSLSSVVIALCAITVYLIIIMFFSWPLALFVVVLGGLIKILLSGLKQPLRHIGFEVTKINEELSLRMSSRMQALKAIRARALEEQETKAFTKLSDAVAKAFTKMSFVGTYINPINDVALLLVIGLLIWFSSYIGNPVTVTATAIALLYRLKPYVYSLEGALLTLVSSQGPLEAVLKQLDVRDIREDDKKSCSLSKDWKILRFDNVNFGYDDEEKIIENLSFELPRGKVLGVKGDSGAGKSTLVNMLLKLTDPVSGEIWLDDQKLLDIDRQQWLSSVGAAGQDFELIDGSVLENITLGQNLDEEDIHGALKIAEIAEFVDTLPEKLETRIGERGIRLSGGQRQRIVLARSIACKPEILIMDEATSAIDLNTEDKIYSNIKNHLPNTTIVLITHRTSPDSFVDIQIALN